MDADDASLWGYSVLPCGCTYGPTGKVKTCGEPEHE